MTIHHTRYLAPEEFFSILDFLTPQELLKRETTCKAWRAFILSIQWPRQCRIRLNLPPTTQLKDFLPSDCTPKKGALTLSPKIFDATLYRYYLGVEISHPPLPSQNFSAPDPWDRTRTIGQNYTWIYIPDTLTIPSSETPLKVDHTIHKILELFNQPQAGNPSELYFCWPDISNQHLNKKAQPKWVCLREGLVEPKKPFSEQEKAAKKFGMEISPLLHRIIFNCFTQVSSRTQVGYVDAKHLWLFARTSTDTTFSSHIIPAACGLGEPAKDGLRLLPAMQNDQAASVEFP